MSKLYRVPNLMLLEPNAYVFYVRSYRDIIANQRASLYLVVERYLIIAPSIFFVNPVSFHKRA